jgi:hypothetical protein
MPTWPCWCGVRERGWRRRRCGRGCVIYGVTASGAPQEPGGISVVDEGACIAGLQAVGIDLAGLWDKRRHATARDAEIAAWVAYRLATAAHPAERAMIERRLRALSLPHLIP